MFRNNTQTKELTNKKLLVSSFIIELGRPRWRRMEWGNIRLTAGSSLCSTTLRII